MPISPFILKLREKIGHDLILLPAISAVVINDKRELLLVDSKDADSWMPVGGMVEPGEEPADAAVREVLEETGVHVVPHRLVGVYDGPSVTYPNGDRTHYMTVVFLCKPIAGEPHAADEENRDARYFPVDQLPPMRADHQRNIDAVLANRVEADFHFRG